MQYNNHYINICNIISIKKFNITKPNDQNSFDSKNINKIFIIKINKHNKLFNIIKRSWITISSANESTALEKLQPVYYKNVTENIHAHTYAYTYTHKHLHSHTLTYKLSKSIWHSPSFIEKASTLAIIFQFRDIAYRVIALLRRYI